GIRDYKVTGVQTCALPICRLAEPLGERDDGLDHVLAGLVGDQVADKLHVDLEVADRKVLQMAEGSESRAEVVEREATAQLGEPRSEERRVGKGWGERWVVG